MTPDLARLLFDPVGWLPAWRGAGLTGAARTAVNQLLVRQHGLPCWEPARDHAADSVRRLVQGWDHLDAAATLIGCAALGKRLMATTAWTSLPAGVHEFVMAGYAIAADDAELDAASFNQARRIGARRLLGHSLGLPHWLSARVALRFGLTPADAMPVDRTCLWNALKHATRYPDLRDPPGH